MRKQKSKRKHTPLSFAAFFLRKRLSILFPAVFMPVFVLIYAALSYADIAAAPALGWDLPVIFAALTLFGFLCGHVIGERFQAILDADTDAATRDIHITRWSVAVSTVWVLATIWKLGGFGTLFSIPFYWLVRRACYACVDAYNLHMSTDEKAKAKVCIGTGSEPLSDNGGKKRL